MYCIHLSVGKMCFQCRTHTNSMEGNEGHTAHCIFANSYCCTVCACVYNVVDLEITFL